eukprot:g3114.t1
MLRAIAQQVAATKQLQEASGTSGSSSQSRLGSSPSRASVASRRLQRTSSVSQKVQRAAKRAMGMMKMMARVNDDADEAMLGSGTMGVTSSTSGGRGRVGGGTGGGGGLGGVDADEFLQSINLRSTLSKEAAIRAQLRALETLRGNTPGPHLIQPGDRAADVARTRRSVKRGKRFVLRPRVMIHNVNARNARIGFCVDLALYLGFFLLFMLWLVGSRDVYRSHVVEEGIQKLMEHVSGTGATIPSKATGDGASPASEESSGATWQTMDSPAEFFDYLETGLIPALYSADRSYSGRA